MKTGYSFGSLVSFTEALNAAAVKITGDQTIAGVKTFSSNPISSAAQGMGGSYLTRKDYVDDALALKAPLASPVFTGNPTAPTAALFDGDTTIATTAFVQRALGNHQSYVWTGDATIQPTWAGCFIWYDGAGTLYLPNYVNVPMGATFEIMCTGSGAITAQSGEPIILPNGVHINSFTPLAGDTVKFVRLDVGWAYSGTSYTPTAAASDNSTRPASTAHVKNYLLSSPQLAGAVHVEGTVNATGEYQTTNAVGYRIAYADYGAFWYSDAARMYLMFTNIGDKWGGSNSLRPFYADCRTGRVGMANGVSISGGLVVTEGLDVTGGATFNQNLSTKQYILVNGNWWRDTQPYTVEGNYACSAVYDVYFEQLPTTDSFFPIVGATANTANDGYQTRVKFGVYTDGTLAGWGRKYAGIWVGNGENTLGPKYLYKFNPYGGFYCNAVVADTTITAGTSINAGGAISAPHLVSTSVDQDGLRFTGGHYGVMCYNDSAENFYFLLTNKDDQLGGFNNLRPFTINKRSGLVYHQQGLSVSAGLWTDQAYISSTTNSAPTQAAGTNNTTIATTAFVQSTATSIVTDKASSAAPLMNGAATAGTSTNYTREGHVHPTDTSRAPLASPALTGTPTAPTASRTTDNTQLATTHYVRKVIGGYRQATQLSSTTVMDESCLGSLISPSATQAITWTLPDNPTSGDIVEIHNPTGLKYNIVIKPPTGYIYYEGVQYTSIPYSYGRMKFVFAAAWLLLDVSIDDVVISNPAGFPSVSVTLPFGTKRITVTLYDAPSKQYSVVTIPVNTLSMYGNGTYKLRVEGNRSYGIDYTYDQSSRLLTASVTGGLITYINAEA